MPLELPTGTVTFLFTDIQGSTRLWEQHPDVMRQAVTRHDALIESAVTLHHGVLVRPRGEGDSRFAVFSRASDGVAAACEVGQLLLKEPWPAAIRLDVRVAVHSGECDLRDGDYYGSAVNRCARLRMIAHGGQILLSGVTARLSAGQLPAGVSLRDLGVHPLKDLEESERVFQLLHPALPSHFSPLVSAKTVDNLPSSLTSFVGRDVELAQVQRLLGSVRLLTLVGTGGVGKTRLALHAAAAHRADFADGTFFIDLSAIRDPVLVPSTVAQVLGVREAGDGLVEERLLDFIRERTMLLLFDNFEQVLPAAPLVSAILRHCPHVKVIATSRAPLRVSGEHVFGVPPLGAPDLNGSQTIDELLAYPSVVLFAERARAAQVDFTFTPETATDIAMVCTRLEGMPLAIELAAARTRLLSPSLLRSRLNDRLRLLVGGPRDRPERQQTLRGTIDWSYKLLSASQQTLFRRLGVFVGGCTLEAAESICAGQDTAAQDVLEGLSELADQSLIQRTSPRFDGELLRFGMLESISGYAAELLVASGELAMLRSRHAQYFLDLAEAADSQLRGGPRQLDWLERMRREQDNLRAARAWAEERGERELHLRLAAATARFWWRSGQLEEGQRWLEDALERPGEAPALLRGKALNGIGILTWYRGNYARAAAYLDESLALHRTLGDTWSIAYTVACRGVVAFEQDEWALAEELLSESLALFRALGDAWGVTSALDNLGEVARLRGADAVARTLFEEGLAVARAHADEAQVASALVNLAAVAEAEGDHNEAARLAGECLRLLPRRPGPFVSYGLELMAAAAVARGRPERAARLCGAAEAVCETFPRRRSGLPALARTRAALGATLAEEELTTAWATGRRLSLERVIAEALEESVSN